MVLLATVPMAVAHGLTLINQGTLISSTLVTVSNTRPALPLSGRMWNASGGGGAQLGTCKELVSSGRVLGGRGVTGGERPSSAAGWQGPGAAEDAQGWSPCR